MITFKPIIRNIRADNFAAVYIRVTKNRKADYIKTNFIAKTTQLKGKNLKDYTLISKVSVLIQKYIERLNQEDTEFWTAKEVVKFLIQENAKISFTDFYTNFVGKMLVDGRTGSAANYQSAINSLLKFAGQKNLYFSDVNSRLINGWLESLKNTNVAKNHYPVYISAVFKAGTLHYNDYERGIIRIKNQPFMHVKVPDIEAPEKRAVERETLLKIFNVNLSDIEKSNFTELAKDVSMLIFHLAGINTIDLHNLAGQNFKGGKLCYNRKKTAGERKDKAYMEITVPMAVLPLFQKYRGKDGKLFSFSEMYKNARTFNRFINVGLKNITDFLKIERVTTYTFRHSWATIAQNNCGASDAEVAFALNHASEYRITKGYIKTDFAPIDRLNEKVLSYVFEN